MTAHRVILAQTRVGFLTGGRKQSFLDLAQDEQAVQMEEAYARATVAITRARALCLIMGPLDMKGLIGAATACMVLGMCGQDTPTSICMIASSAVPLLMHPSSICLNRTVVWQAHTFLPPLLLKSFRTMLPTFIK